MLRLALSAALAVPFLTWSTIDVAPLASAGPSSGVAPVAAATALTAVVVDNGTSGYAEPRGSWSVSGLAGVVGDSKFSQSADAVATFSFGPQSGRFEVFASWPAHANSTTNALYLIECGGVLVGTALRAQANVGGAYVSLGWVDATGGNLVVTVANAPSGVGVLRADTVKIETTAAQGSAILPHVASAWNYGVQSFLYLTNITDQPLSVTVSLFGRDGSLLTTSAVPALESVAPEYPTAGLSDPATFYSSGKTLTVTVLPHAIGGIQFQIPGDETTANFAECWGTVSWTQQNGASKEALIATVVSYRNEGIYVFPTNGGKPF